MAKRICTVEGCTKLVNGHGLCPHHYYLQKTYGSTTPRPPRPTFTERFWAKVDKSGECWTWTAQLDPKGYGRILRRRGSTMAHRVAYESLVGPVPPALQLDHICRNRACVNPEHLRIVDNKQNRENLTAAQQNNKSSGVRGVCWHCRTNKWQVHVGHNGRKYHGGYFDSLADAEAAAIALRLKLYTHNELDKETAC